MHARVYLVKYDFDLEGHWEVLEPLKCPHFLELPLLLAIIFMRVVSLRDISYAT